MNLVGWKLQAGIAGAAAVVAAALATAATLKIDAWRYGEQIAELKQEHATELRVAAQAAQDASEKYRKLETSVQGALDAERNKYQAQLDASLADRRELTASNTGLRNALAAATARSRDPAADPSSRTGADDPGTLRVVAGECTSEYAALAEAAHRAGLKLTGLQGYAGAVQKLNPPYNPN